MLKKLSALFILVLLIPVLLLAQDRPITKKAPVVVNEPSVVQTSSYSGGGNMINANFVAVDTMGNAYGPAIAPLNPLSYDPFSNVIAVVHRGGGSYGVSGEIWYNYSQDGVNWIRTPAAINSLVTLVGRYPSMTLSNPTHSTDMNNVTAAFSWPHLNPGAFGFIGYGVDQPVGAGFPFSALDEGPPAYSSQVPTFASDNSNWIFWTSDNTVDASLRLWKTEDYSVVDVSDPPQWADSVFDSGGNVTFGGTSYNGVDYYGTLGTFNENYAPNPIVSGWYAGYSKSTDNGVTWSNFNVADFRDIESLNKYDRIFDYKKGDTYVSYEGDINVDKDGKIHMLIQVTDTTSSDNEGVNALVEVYEDETTASGWNGKVVFEGFDDNLFTVTTVDNSPNIGQMGPSGHLAFDADREILFAKWVGSPTGAPADTVMDMFYSWRTLDGEWSTPVNITNTPNISEAGSHLAPLMKKEAVTGGYDVTAFVMYWYEVGNTTPSILPTAPSVIYVSPVTFFVPVTGIEDGINPVSFALEQNYPNPFNPSTVIKYSLAERSNVTLDVYDVLGKKVASLINSNQEAGTHQINFDASNLASGFYVYTLNTGNFTSSKKMMLIK